jgi:hypothetical protein
VTGAVDPFNVVWVGHAATGSASLGVISGLLKAGKLKITRGTAAGLSLRQFSD